MKVALCLCIVITTLVISGECQRSRRCPGNEVYQECGPSCERGCPSGPTCQISIGLCKQGCFCRGGQVRLPNGRCGPVGSCGVRRG